MKVSVIIPTRNRRNLLLKRSLPSVLTQTFKDFEVVIVNDASEEEYPDDYRAYHPNITYIRNFNRMGLAWNRNIGVDYAKGKYIVFLDDDNEFHPDFLEKTIYDLDLLGEYVEAIGVGKTIVYPEGKVYQKPVRNGSINDGFLMKKEVFQAIRCDENMTANEDADFGIRFHKQFKLATITKPLMTVYGSPIFNTTSYSDYTDYHLDGLAKFWLKHHDYKKYIGRMFLLAAGSPQWFKYLYWLDTKIKRYYQIWSSRKHL